MLQEGVAATKLVNTDDGGEKDVIVLYMGDMPASCTPQSYIQS